MLKKTMPFELEIKSVGMDGEAGVFDGYLSVYNIKDLYGDKVIPGAFDETLNEKNNTFPLLWQHDAHEPIGAFIAKSDDKGLEIKARICLATVKGKEAYELLKMKKEFGFSPLQGMSIGYNPLVDDYEKDGTRLLKKIDLWEGSLVTFPALREATVGQVKSSMSLNHAVMMVAEADPKELAEIEQEFISKARNKLGRVNEKKDDTDRILEFVENEVKGWMK